jgi:hypothetical protein
VREARQGHFRGGVEEPLSFDDLVRKFRANCAIGQVEAARADDILERLADCCRGAAGGPAGAALRMNARVALVTGAGPQHRPGDRAGARGDGVAVAVNVRSNAAEAQAVVDASCRRAGGRVACLADVTNRGSVDRWWPRSRGAMAASTAW